MSEPVLQDEVKVLTAAQLQTTRAVHCMYGMLIGVGTGVSLTLALFILTGLRVC